MRTLVGVKMQVGVVARGAECLAGHTVPQLGATHQSASSQQPAANDVL